MLNLIKIFVKNESGQGITEYGAVLAFIGVLIAFSFTAGNGGLQAAVKNCFSAVAQNTSLLVSAS